MAATAILASNITITVDDAASDIGTAARRTGDGIIKVNYDNQN